MKLKSRLIAVWSCCVLVSSMAHGQRDPAFDVDRLDQLSVVEFEKKLFAGIVRQQKDNTCGAASLATMLTHHLGASVSEAELLKSIKKAGVGPLSVKDIKDMAASRGVTMHAYRMNADALLGEPAFLPAIVRLKTPNADLPDKYGKRNDLGQDYHFVLVTEFKDGVVRIKDPSAGNLKYPVEDFLAVWIDPTISGNKNIAGGLVISTHKPGGL